MRVENGKIIQATETELFTFYLNKSFDDIIPFEEFKRRCIEQGTEVVEDKR